MLLKQQAGIICYTFAHNKGDNRLVTGGEFSAWFVPISALTSQAKRYGVRRQAVSRATPLFKYECEDRVAHKSGAATRAQHGSCHQNFPPRQARTAG